MGCIEIWQSLPWDTTCLLTKVESRILQQFGLKKKRRKKKEKKEELGFPSVTDDTNLQCVLVQIQLQTLRLFRASADSTGQLVVLFSSSSEALTRSSELFHWVIERHHTWEHQRLLNIEVIRWPSVLCAFELQPRHLNPLGSNKGT